MKRERIGLIDLVPVVARYHMVFVCIALSNPGNKCLPDARLAPWLELMAGLVPAVEPPHDIHLLRVGCPHSEIGARGAVHCHRVRPEMIVQPDVAAFVKEIQVVIAEQRHVKVQQRRPPFAGFFRRLVEHAAASWVFLWRLMGHFGEVPPPTDLRD